MKGGAFFAVFLVKSQKIPCDDWPADILALGGRGLSSEDRQIAVHFVGYDRHAFIKAHAGFD